MASKTLILGMSVRVFLEEIGVWITRLRLEILGTVQSPGDQNGPKRGRKGKFSLLAHERLEFSALNPSDPGAHTGVLPPQAFGLTLASHHQLP